jgi:fructose-1-phosphate kinase PfkB-like protein
VKGVHDALGIKELDEEMVLTSPWGGFTGERIKKECEEREIKCLGAEVEYWNRTFLIIKSKDEFNQPETLGLDPQIGPKEYDLFLKQYKRLLKKPSLFA